MDENQFNENIIKAVEDDADAQFTVGMCYLLGNGIKRNYKEAYKWISKSAEHNNVEAIHMLGELYKNGIYVSENYEKAITYYQKAGELGAPVSQNEVGINCGRHGDFEQALFWFLKAAEQDYAPAMTNIARIYIDGFGTVKKNITLAIKYLQKAIALDDNEAMNIMGCIFLDGNGIEKNSKEAIKLFKKSSKLNNPHAKINLANLYEEGCEITQDIEKAIELWNDVAEIDEEAYRKIEVYAKKGVASAQYYYSNFFEFDEKSETLKWLKKSADNGFAAAQYELGICYRDGLNVDKDYAKAKFYLTEAMKQYYDGAAFALNVLETYTPKAFDNNLSEQEEIEGDFFSLECQIKDLKKYTIENKGGNNSVFELKIIGKVGPGALREGGSINKWLEESSFNGKFGLDLSEAEGLDYIPNNAFYKASFRKCNVNLKYVYLPNSVKDIGSCAFTNQRYLDEIRYSNDFIQFQSCCLEATAITELKFPKEYSIWDNSVSWSHLTTIMFPSNFCLEPPIQPDFPSKNSKRFNNWDLFIEKCSNLNKIIIHNKEDELEKSQLEFLDFLKKKRKDIKIDFSN